MTAAAKQDGTSEVWRHSNPKETNSDWRTVSCLYATYSEECQEHNKATIDVEQGNWNGSCRQWRNSAKLGDWVCKIERVDGWVLTSGHPNSVEASALLRAAASELRAARAVVGKRSDVAAAAISMIYRAMEQKEVDRLDWT